jgi:CheY-like chemotaxis protein
MPPKRILICDDEANMRELIRVVLEDDYEFAEAEDGLEAVELARELKPDLVILDMMVPRKSGLEVLEELRLDPSFAQPPVVVMTAWHHMEDDAVAAGADRFFVKPFEPDDLREAVAELLAAR